jgi:hypothetical protein
MSLHLADAAKRLGNDSVIMESYWNYHERTQNWFFSPNDRLDNAARRPSSFPSQGDWDKLTSPQRIEQWNAFTSKQRMMIATLAGFGYEGRGINQ